MRLLCAMLPALALVIAAAGCSGKGESTTPEAGEEDPVIDEAAGEGSGEGWRWKGKRDDCFFLHDNNCFDSLAAACKAAGCSGDRCEHDDGAPATVSCTD